jgi:hypothetical protein
LGLVQQSLCFKFGASASEQQMHSAWSSNFFGNGAGYEAKSIHSNFIGHDMKCNRGKELKFLGRVLVWCNRCNNSNFFGQSAGMVKMLITQIYWSECWARSKLHLIQIGQNVKRCNKC